MTKLILYVLALATFLFEVSAFAKKITDNSLRLGDGSSSSKTIEFNKGSGSANPKIKYNGSTGKIQYANDGSNFKDVGSGAGGRNFLEIGDAESGAGSWVCSGTASMTVSTSSPLAGSASWIYTPGGVGDTCYHAFTIDPMFRAKMLRIDGEYALNSGAFATGDAAIEIYDVTNSTTIPVTPSNIAGIAGDLSAPIQQGEFQTAFNSTSYRLVLKRAAGTGTLKLDELKVGPQVKNYGQFAGAWASYPCTLTTSGGGAITLNSTSSVALNCKYRMIVDSIEVQASFRNGSGGAASGNSGNVQISLPAGMTPDTSKMSATVAGTKTDGYARVSSSTSHSNIMISGSNIIIERGDNGAVLVVADLAASYYASLQVRVPIVGWGSAQQLSSDAGTRLVSARVYKNGTQSITTTTKITGWTVDSDTTGVWDAANDRFLIREPGDYDLIVNTNSAPSTVATQGIAYAINGGALTYIGAFSDASAQARFGATAFLPKLKPNDYIELSQHTNGNTTIQAGTGNTSFAIVKRSGPAQVSASESVGAKYVGHAAGVALSSSAVIVKPNIKSWDSHSLFNTSTGEIKLPFAGEFRITAHIDTNSVVGASSQYSALEIRTGAVANSGTLIAQNTQFHPTSATNTPCAVSTKVRGIGGDTFSVQATSNVGSSRDLSTVGHSVWIEVERTGN